MVYFLENPRKNEWFGWKNCPPYFMDTFHQPFCFKVPMFRKPKNSSESSEKKEQRLARYPADKNGWLMARDPWFCCLQCLVEDVVFFCWQLKIEAIPVAMLVEKKCCVDVSRTAVLLFRGCTCRPIPMIHPFLWGQNTCFTICRQLLLLLLRMSPIKTNLKKWFVTSMSITIQFDHHHPIWSCWVKTSNFWLVKFYKAIQSWPRSIFQIWRSVHLRAIHP